MAQPLLRRRAPAGYVEAPRPGARRGSNTCRVCLARRGHSSKSSRSVSASRSIRRSAQPGAGWPRRRARARWGEGVSAERVGWSTAWRAVTPLERMSFLGTGQRCTPARGSGLDTRPAASFANDEPRMVRRSRELTLVEVFGRRAGGVPELVGLLVRKKSVRCRDRGRASPTRALEGPGYRPSRQRRPRQVA